MKKNDRLTLTIDTYAYEGRGIAKLDIEQPAETDEPPKPFVVFVDGAYPGDTVEAEIRRKKKRYAEARVVKLLEPSPQRIEPRCPYFDACGGCKQQDLGYATQLHYKQAQVVETFERIGGMSGFEVEPILASEETYYYRNKMDFSFARKRWLTPEEIASDKEFDSGFALGLHVPRIYDKVIDLETCFLQSETSAAIVNFTRGFYKPRETTIYSTQTHDGYLRNLVIRIGENTGDLMVNLVTSEENEELMKEYTAALLEKFPQVTTVINNINTRKAAISQGEYEIVYHGPGVIHDIIGERKFRVSANSFFQTNTKQGRRLYQTALEYADFKGDKVVYDLYCGAGTISLFVAGEVKEVHGFEAVQDAINDANVNKELNGLDNAEFYTADLYKTFLPLVEEKKIPRPDVIILDPPRSGMHPVTVEDVIALGAPKIVYVSCNPATQSRDVKLLAENGYRLVKLRPVDMFPHTYHIENVALLVKDA